MSFASALNVLRPTLPYYLALVKYGLLRLTRDSFEFYPNPDAPALAAGWQRRTAAPSRTPADRASRDRRCRGRSA